MALCLILFLFLRDQEVLLFNFLLLRHELIVRFFDEVFAACEDFNCGRQLLDLIILIADGLLQFRVLELGLFDRHVESIALILQSLLLLLHDVQFLSQVGNIPLSVGNLFALRIELSFELLDHIVLLHQQCLRCLILLRSQRLRCGFRLFFLGLSDCSCSSSFFFEPGSFLRFALGKLLSLHLILKLFHLLFLLECALSEHISFWNGSAMLFQFLLQYYNLHLVRLNFLLCFL